jgi:hypothetical protein
MNKHLTAPPFTPALGHGRATAALFAAIGIITVLLVVTLATVIFIAVTSIPPGCGFNASDACTNPSANDTTSEVLSLLVAVGMAAATTWLVSATVGRVLGAARAALRRRVVAGFAAALVVALGAGPVVLIFATSRTDFGILIGAAIMLVVIVWPVILCEVQHAARPSNPAPAEDSRP